MFSYNKVRNYNKERSLRIWELAALLALSISLCAGAWAEARQSSISSRLIRLHVIAASDETQEQEIKLRVRDAVLDVSGSAARRRHGRRGRA